MQSQKPQIIYTIGHSTRSMDDFLGLLKEFGIEVLADIRRFPGSRKYPWFNKENLEKDLRENNIIYIHMESLGGRRKVQADSQNDRWKNDSFRGYADYMETGEFKNAVKKLEETASEKTTAYMCSEAVWWSCHRSMVSDYLKAAGWKVLHIMNQGKAEEHPYTSAARIVDGQVCYSDENLFS
ncbi:Fe-S cluster assembly protein HesB [Chryseobacterium indologenes]|uniref:Fe-S cluster assembly protein HesB n=2 Tax=Chryseobacterium indologenes TaxID=253 RepID=A0A0N0ZUC4_CHRID|nr:Fe-S cluster assembly protein HesB [Chryseobacterium indologenes]